MEKIQIATSDSIIWNESQVHKSIVGAMLNDQDIVLDFMSEGPDINALNLYNWLTDFAQIFDYNLKRIKIVTANALEHHDTIAIEYNPALRLLNNAKEYLIDLEQKNISKHFGMFIGRSNAPRLLLASYLDSQFQEQSVYTYHFNSTDEFHLNNIGLEELLRRFNQHDLSTAAKFLEKCPILLDTDTPTIIDKSIDLNPAQQLLKNDNKTFSQHYKDFFVEVVCESYFTGNTFFVTEKTWRPVLLKTPFIVQGPQYFLRNLKKLGFKTFDQWWDEGYDEDPVDHRLVEIKKVINNLSTQTTEQLSNMYESMQATLEHNYQLCLTLKLDDFKTISC